MFTKREAIEIQTKKIMRLEQQILDLQNGKGFSLVAPEKAIAEWRKQIAKENRILTKAMTTIQD